MISYADGTEARVGDLVDMDGQPAVVEAVIGRAEVERGVWGVTEPGLMFRTDITLHVPNERGDWVERTFSNDLVFESADSQSWDAIVFQGRADAETSVAPDQSGHIV